MDGGQNDTLFNNNEELNEKHKVNNAIPKDSGDQKPKPLDFSYSRMDMYRQCPLKYKFRYVDRIKEKPKGFFFFGSAIHAALEFLYKGDSPIFPSMAQVCQAFLDFWFSKPLALQGFRNNEESARKREEGLLMLKEYYRVNQGQFKRAFLTERIFKFEIDGLMVTAISDRMDYVGDGKLLITDYKTGKDVKRTPGQLYMYQKIAESNPELPGLLAERLGVHEDSLKISQMLYYHVPTNKQYFFDRADDSQIKEFWDGALATAEQIRANRFDPKPSEFACKWCDFKQYCPVFGGNGRVPGHGNILPEQTSIIHNTSSIFQNTSSISENTSSISENTSSISQNTSPIIQNTSSISENTSHSLKDTSGLSLTQMLNRYGDLEERKAVIEREQKALAERILEIASPGEYVTGRYSAKIGTSSSWKAIDREAVIALLREYNLYGRACTLTLSGIVSLLGSGYVPEKFKIRLASLLRKEECGKVDIRKNNI